MKGTRNTKHRRVRSRKLILAKKKLCIRVLCSLSAALFALFFALAVALLL